MPTALPRLYAHPFSSYCQKALIAFYENDVPFTYRMLEDAGVGEEFASLWPMKRFPILRENGRVVLEASIVIEYLQIHHPGPVKLIPEDPDLANVLEAAQWLTTNKWEPFAYNGVDCIYVGLKKYKRIAEGAWVLVVDGSTPTA